jgi:hypothetical protein
MLETILFCIVVYLIAAVPVMLLIWASLVLAHQDDLTRGVDPG